MWGSYPLHMICERSTPTPTTPTHSTRRPIAMQPQSRHHRIRQGQKRKPCTPPPPRHQTGRRFPPSLHLGGIRRTPTTRQRHLSKGPLGEGSGGGACGQAVVRGRGAGHALHAPHLRHRKGRRRQGAGPCPLAHPCHPLRPTVGRSVSPSVGRAPANSSRISGFPVGRSVGRHVGAGLWPGTCKGIFLSYTIIFLMTILYFHLHWQILRHKSSFLNSG